MATNTPYNLDKALLKEINVRGRYLTMSCDIEYCLLNIILFCNPNPTDHDRAGQFKQMTMGGKIDAVICDMKEYKNADYLQYKEYFDGLTEFRNIRNHAAHDKAEFINEQLDTIKFTFLDSEKKGEKPYGKYVNLPDLFIEQSLIRFGKINYYLGFLWKKYADGSSIV